MSTMSNLHTASDRKDKRNLSVFGADSLDLQKILQQLKPANLFDCENIADSPEVDESTSVGNLADLQISTAMSCTTCAIVFDDRDEQKEHFQTDWHRYNLKQRLKGANTVTEMDFEDLADDISSISGSEESDGSEDLSDADISSISENNKGLTPAEIVVSASKNSVLHMRTSDGNLLSVYRAVLYCKKEYPEDVYDILNRVKRLTSNNVWIILMMSGGHFAAAVFENGSVLTHKTFHRYVVRAKCGTSQSQHDKKGSHAQSAGANLRRYNEAALAQEITELLQSWKSYIDRSHLIFVRLSTHNYRYVFSKKESSHLNKDDSRVRAIPFPTHRPTFKEVKRVHAMLSSVTVTEGDERLTETDKLANENKSTKPKEVKHKTNQKSPQDTYKDELRAERVRDTSPLTPTRQRKSKKRSTPEHLSAQESSGTSIQNECLMAIKDTVQCLPMRSEFYTACLVGDEEKVKQLVDRLRDESEGEKLSSLISRPVSSSGQTMLHLACESVHPNIIRYLLEVGCDPSVSDQKNVVPYLSTKNKSARNQFRLFMGHFPNKYDYKKAQIPGPIDEEKAAEIVASERARKQEANKKKREHLKERKAALAVKRQEDEEKARFLALSDREKRALAAEQRLLQSREQSGALRIPLSRCHRCAVDITGKVPFEYSNNVFCSPKCLKEHRLSQR